METILSNNLRFESDNSKAAEDNVKLLMHILMQMMAKKELSFYGHIVSFFTFKFIKDGHLRPDFDVGVEVKGTKVTMVINPFVFFDKSESQMMFRLIHETEHVLRMDILFNPKESAAYNAMVKTVHKTRDEKGNEVSYEKQTPLATLAMDLAVNSLKYSGTGDDPNNYKLGQDYLLQEGLFPKEGAFKNLPPYKLWQYYYEEMYKKAQNNEDGFSMDGNGGMMGGPGDISVDPDKLGIPGSALNNSWSSLEQMSPIEIESYKSFVYDVIQQAIEKSAGNIPGQYQKLIDELNQPKFDWKKALKQFIARGISTTLRTSRRKINKRAINLKAIMPGWMTQRECNVAAWIDTSGSISHEQFCNSVNHLNKIRKSTNANVWIGAFDAAVHSFHKLEKRNMKKILSTQINHTSGGTLFRPMFDYMIENKIKPDCMIIFTDGYNFDKDALRTNPIKNLDVMWVYTKDHQKQDWGRHLVMEDEY